MSRGALNAEYARRYKQVLTPLSVQIEKFIREHFGSYQRIDRISARPKSLERFLEKATKTLPSGMPKYDDPLNQIQDQIGARIITYYREDVDNLVQIVPKYFRQIEQREIVPDSEREFGYEGYHFVLFVPEDVVEIADRAKGAPVFFELQIKTLFQHAWSEAEHDLGYKPLAALSKEQKRRIAFTAAQAWGADQIFQELFLDLHRS